MAYEQRDFSGGLFKNDRKTKEDHPNATGSCKVDGIEYWLSAWTKKGKDGNPWQSLAFTKKEAKPQAAASQEAAKPDFDDSLDIPF